MRITKPMLINLCPNKIREIEMAVDACLQQQAYAIQFWKDVNLYGLWEAFVYLRNYVDSYKYDKIVNQGRLEQLRIIIIQTSEYVQSRQKKPRFDSKRD